MYRSFKRAFGVAATVVMGVMSPMTRLSAQNWSAVDRILSRMSDGGADAVSTVRVPQLWTAFDAAIVAQLNAHTSLDSLNQVLSRRPGFEGPSAGQPTVQISGATFWRELPRDAPNYFVAAIDAPGTTLLSIVQTPTMNGPSHLAVIQRRGGVWQKTSSFSSPTPLAAFRIPARSGLLLATFETWTRADGSESRVALWRLTEGHLSRIPRHDTTQFQDADVRPTDTSLVVSVSQFPRYVSACTMCTRLEFAYNFTASARGVDEQRTALNPWAFLVDSLYAMIAVRKNGAAKALLPSTVTIGAVSGKRPEFVSDSGDLQRGIGFADISLNMWGSCARYWRYSAARQPGGAWHIVTVRPGRWTGDSVVFDDQASKRQQPNDRCS